jgi:hypothetical protein
MNAVMLEQTAFHLTRRVRRWDLRLRLVTSLLWGPRGLLTGLLVGVTAAVVSRMRPWLLPEQIALITGIVAAVGLLGVLATVWLWPRSVTRGARYFDRRFGLKERVSTALELSGGVIPVPETLAEYQLSDAVSAADGVNVSSRLPVRVRVWEIVGIIVLGALLVYMLLADNPQVDALRTRHDLQQTISDQVAQLDQAIEEINQNSALSQEEQNALTQPLTEARDILQQPNISQQEAVAAMAEANQALKNMSGGMSPEQQSAYQQAASQLRGSDLTSDLAQALKQPNLGAASQAANALADKLNDPNLSVAAQQDLANRLEQAAEQLQQTNPDVAQKLREAAQALRKGDTEAARQALKEASDLLKKQQEQLQNSPMAKAAQSAQQQVNQSQQKLAQAGQGRPPDQAGPARQDQQQGQSGQESQQGQQAQSGQPGSQAQQAQSGQQNQAAPGEQSSQGQEGQLAQQQAEAGQTGDMQIVQGSQQSSEGQAQSQSQSQMQSQAEGAAQSQGQAVPGQSPSTNPGEGESQTSVTGSAQDQGQVSISGSQGLPTGQGQSEIGQGASGAGEGQGGTGVNTTTGVSGESQQGEISTDNSPAPGSLQQYNPAYAPSTIGGQSQQPVNVGGDANVPGDVPVQEGDFGPNPHGQSNLSYTGVSGDYQNIVSDALESGRIPLDQRDVIHDYFSSLNR